MPDNGTLFALHMTAEGVVTTNDAADSTDSTDNTDQEK